MFRVDKWKFKSGIFNVLHIMMFERVLPLSDIDIYNNII